MLRVMAAWAASARPIRAAHRASMAASRTCCSPAVATQDSADVLSTELGRAIVSNAATQILLRQAPQAIDEVAAAFRLSEGEQQFLLSAARGSGLLAVGGTDRAVFASLASPTENALITTSPEFLASVENPDGNSVALDTDTDIDLGALPTANPRSHPGDGLDLDEVLETDIPEPDAA